MITSIPCNNWTPSILRYEVAKAKGKDNYDREMEEVLERHVVECDRKIQRSLKRLEDDRVEGAGNIQVSKITKVGRLVTLGEKSTKEKGMKE